MNKNIFQKTFLVQFHFQKIVFFPTKKKLRNFLFNHIDVEFCQESIFRTHKYNGAVLKVLITA